jgi:hypothetical protein
MTNEDTDRMNRNVADVFWIRHGRDPDRTDPEDRIRLDAIMDWQCRGAPLPPVDEARIGRRIRTRMVGSIVKATA